MRGPSRLAMTIALSLLWLSLLSKPSCSWTTDPVVITADDLHYSPSAEVIEGSGCLEVRMGKGTILNAARVQVNMKANNLLAIGKVTLKKNNGEIVTGEAFSYNYSMQKGYFLKLEGTAIKKIEISGESFRQAEWVSDFPRDSFMEVPSDPASGLWIKSRQAIIAPGRNGYLKSASFMSGGKVGKRRFWWPYYEIEMGAPLARIGSNYSSYSGFNMDIPFIYAYNGRNLGLLHFRFAENKTPYSSYSDYSPPQWQLGVEQHFNFFDVNRLSFYADGIGARELNYRCNLMRQFSRSMNFSESLNYMPQYKMFTSYTSLSKYGKYGSLSMNYNWQKSDTLGNFSPWSWFVSWQCRPLSVRRIPFSVSPMLGIGNSQYQASTAPEWDRTAGYNVFMSPIYLARKFSLTSYYNYQKKLYTSGRESASTMTTVTLNVNISPKMDSSVSYMHYQNNEYNPFLFYQYTYTNPTMSFTYNYRPKPGLTFSLNAQYDYGINSFRYASGVIALPISRRQCFNIMPSYNFQTGRIESVNFFLSSY